MRLLDARGHASVFLELVLRTRIDYFYLLVYLMRLYDCIFDLLLLVVDTPLPVSALRRLT